MLDKPIDQIAETLRTWTTELTVALNAAGFGCHYASHTGSSSIRLGRLTAKLRDTDEHYAIDFERKLIVRANERRVITALEVYNPNGGLHVHITKFSDATVAKIVGYAKTHVEAKIAREKASDAEHARMKLGCEIAQKAFAGFTFPDWVDARANYATDADVGTFRLCLRDHRCDFPLNRLGPEQVMAVIDVLRNINSLTPPPVSAWRPATEPVPPELQSTPMKVKMLLLAIEGREQAVRGWFMGGLVNEFYMEGSPSQWKPTHWMPIPEMPR